MFESAGDSYDSYTFGPQHLKVCHFSHFGTLLLREPDRGGSLNVLKDSAMPMEDAGTACPKDVNAAQAAAMARWWELGASSILDCWTHLDLTLDSSQLVSCILLY